MAAQKDREREPERQAAEDCFVQSRGSLNCPLFLVSVSVSVSGKSTSATPQNGVSLYTVCCVSRASCPRVLLRPHKASLCSDRYLNLSQLTEATSSSSSSRRSHTGCGMNEPCCYLSATSVSRGNCICI